ncbi:helix-turn-helix domain-containing protein [Flavobacterium sediminilitoris]|jgi:DNA-binding XRE family transcriptional regulator|uniref:Helix-turn-helix domain-containing protein n=1 Tax=Flavobacterium sediminilitoris TaxID=2024526 RepID=A0ABY4HIL6_9FLAO|nr:MULTISPECIES: helix-turn-helix domain-containing protein [Flavobacterium]UOX32375.1 helix-turn-helix domain-containing protein [Flavobacterium sediminilitoris]
MKQEENKYLPQIEKVAKRFKQLRKEAGYESQETFAFDKELNRVQYWRIEKGSNITLTTFFKLLDVHNITPEEFFKDF